MCSRVGTMYNVYTRIHTYSGTSTQLLLYDIHSEHSYICKQWPFARFWNMKPL